MLHLSLKRMLTTTTVLLGLALASSPGANAQVPYSKRGQLKRSNYWRSVYRYYKVKTKRVRSDRMRFVRSSTLPAASGRFTVVKGKAKSFFWDRKEKQLRVAVFIDAADPLGISIENLKPGDQIQIVSIAGKASFSKAKNTKDNVGSIIGAVADGAEAFLPKFKKVIDAGEKLAATLINMQIKDKQRDGYGKNLNGSGYARQEGGILISMPAAQGPFYSGAEGGFFGIGGSKAAWVQGSGKQPRYDKYRPKEMRANNGAFFPVRGLASNMNRRVRANGVLYVTPWDWKFKDNAGMYKVHLLITRGEQSGEPPVVQSKRGSKFGSKFGTRFKKKVRARARFNRGRRK